MKKECKLLVPNSYAECTADTLRILHVSGQIARVLKRSHIGVDHLLVAMYAADSPAAALLTKFVSEAQSWKFIGQGCVVKLLPSALLGAVAVLDPEAAAVFRKAAGTLLAGQVHRVDAQHLLLALLAAPRIEFVLREGGIPLSQIVQLKALLTDSTG